MPGALLNALQSSGTYLQHGRLGRGGGNQRGQSAVVTPRGSLFRHEKKVCRRRPWL